MSDQDEHRGQGGCTEQQLDEALLELQSRIRSHGRSADRKPQTRTNEDVLAAVRGQLMALVKDDDRSGAPVCHSRRRSARQWWVTAAAAMVVIGLVVGALLSTVIPNAQPAAAAAAETLNRAAAAVTGSVDAAVAAGQYRYIGTHAWYLHNLKGPTGTPLSYLGETVTEVWVPADQSQEWVMDRHSTGRRQWIQGTEQAARKAGVPVDPTSPRGEGQLRARCGDFYAVDTGQQPCTTPGTWQTPNAAFLAGLPRDPQQLVDRLRHDAPHNQRGDAAAFVYAADLLRSGLPQADLRAALYHALTRLHGLAVTDNAADLDGRRGTALGIDNRTVRQEMIIDPATGVFIGEREVVSGSSTVGLPTGTIRGFTSVTTGVVDALGARPPK